MTAAIRLQFTITCIVLILFVDVCWRCLSSLEVDIEILNWNTPDSIELGLLFAKIYQTQNQSQLAVGEIIL